MRLRLPDLPAVDDTIMNKNKHLQQCILALICVICFLQMATPSSAQPAATGASAAWLPTKNVEIIHGSAPGGSNDKRAREVEIGRAHV